MNTVEGGFPHPTQHPKTRQPVNAVQFENVKFLPPSPHPSATSFIAASEMFHESSSFDDDRAVKASWQM
jgi:hypothetical protein